MSKHRSAPSHGRQRRVFRDLGLVMVSFGLLMGAAFPFASAALGVPRHTVVNPRFFAATLAAGAVVGLLNLWLARLVVGRRLRLLAGGMSRIEERLRRVTATGDWDECDGSDCHLPVDSVDEFGMAAASFNHLVDAVASAQRVERALDFASTELARHVEAAPLARAALDVLVRTAGVQACAIGIRRGGRLHPIASSVHTGGTCFPALCLERLQITSPATVRPADCGDCDILPLKSGSDLVGAVLLRGLDREHATTPRLLTLFADRLGVGLGHALLLEQLRQLAAHDELTGACTRRYGLTRLAEEHARVARAGGPLSVLMVDLDHFKAVNDGFGHLAGDQLLADVGRALTAVLREEDVVVRYGGEEFLVGLPGTDVGQAWVVARRVHQALTTVQGSAGRVTASIGLVAAAATDWPLATFISRADEALYDAKRGGRNRTAVAGVCRGLAAS